MQWRKHMNQQGIYSGQRTIKQWHQLYIQESTEHPNNLDVTKGAHHHPNRAMCHPGPHRPRIHKAHCSQGMANPNGQSRCEGHHTLAMTLSGHHLNSLGIPYAPNGLAVPSLSQLLTELCGNAMVYSHHGASQHSVPTNVVAFHR